MPKETIETTKSAKKTKAYLMVLLIGVALTVWSVFFKNKNSDNELVGNKEMSDEEGEDSDLGSEVSSYLEGRLENSDNLVQGNYKLLSALSRIYIKTSRDFSSLVGSDVLVTIDGSTESFTLLNIEKRVEKDGYIQSR